VALDERKLPTRYAWHFGQAWALLADEAHGHGRDGRGYDHPLLDHFGW